MLGTFHFSNPGLDVVKNKQMDITTKSQQQYLVGFSNRVAKGFKPTHVLVECSRNQQEEIDQRFQTYLNGEYKLEVNEIDQIGFRVAKLAGLKVLTCFDEREVVWDAQRLMSELPSKAPKIESEVESTVSTLTKEFDRMFQEMTLKQVLVRLNEEEIDVLNKSFYILTNEVGGNGNGYSGADAAASWWHRNFRMYANIQIAAQEESRVFVIAGQGHTSVLRDFLKLDSKRRAVSIVPYL